MVGGLAVLGWVLIVAGLLLSGEVDDAVTVAGRGDGVEMTLDEYELIENGMTREQVEEIVGGAGALTSSSGSGDTRSEIYSWDGSGGFGANALVGFSGDRVTHKSQFGLR